MQKKKDIKVNLGNQKIYFFLIGMVLALSTVLVAFEWGVYDETDTIVCGAPIKITLEEDEIIPITLHLPPPPPPPAPPILEVVNNSVETTEPIDFVSEDLQDVELEIIAIPEDVEIIIENVPFVPYPQILPSYKGGTKKMYKFLAENLRYPRVALQRGIEGKVYCKFNVMEDGSISEIIILSGIGGGCDEEAKRVIKLFPNWNPAMQGNRKVRTSLTIPIVFTIK